jgi:hypothetical protein
MEAENEMKLDMQDLCRLGKLVRKLALDMLKDTPKHDDKDFIGPMDGLPYPPSWPRFHYFPRRVSTSR